MKVLGITGGVGSGKSEVLDYLESRYGAYVCQMDEVAKRLEKERNMFPENRGQVRRSGRRN